ncbi:MAG: gluconokinase [Bacteroidota bacterium]
MNLKPAYLVMGVSGVGKTTLGKKLAQQQQVPFFDADDFHPPTNVDKMSRGIPLQDADRWPWLARLHQLLQTESQREGLVLACSALKASYRQVLRGEAPPLPLRILFLEAPYPFILQRLQARTQHFMPPSLLQSQFDTLEVPTEALRLDARLPLPVLIEQIIAHYAH